MVDGYISPSIKNTELHNAYIATCARASDVRFRLSSKNRVSYSKFNDFKRSFDFLFMLVGNRTELKYNMQLIEDVKKWLRDKQIKPCNDFMLRGIELFDKFQIAMLETQLISDKV